MSSASMTQMSLLQLNVKEKNHVVNEGPLKIQLNCNFWIIIMKNSGLPYFRKSINMWEHTGGLFQPKTQSQVGKKWKNKNNNGKRVRRTVFNALQDRGWHFFPFPK